MQAITVDLIRDGVVDSSGRTSFRSFLPWYLKMQMITFATSCGRNALMPISNLASHSSLIHSWMPADLDCQQSLGFVWPFIVTIRRKNRATQAHPCGVLRCMVSILSSIHFHFYLIPLNAHPKQRNWAENVCKGNQKVISGLESGGYAGLEFLFEPIWGRTSIKAFVICCCQFAD